MHNVLEDFLKKPSKETFEKIRKNPYLLRRVFELKSELAKEFFEFKEWLDLLNQVGNTEEDRETFMKNLKDSITNFDDARKYFYQLGYDGRQSFKTEFIKKWANSVKDLESLLSLLGNDCRNDIIDKMQSIAVADEEKKIAFYYQKI